MSKGRLEAFSDGVLAIIITIMVLELEVPHAADIAALEPLIPVFLSYVLSFVYVGIYWNNHHHMLHATHSVNGSILWANLHLLFWLSLVPFATGWMGENHFAPAPTALYGVPLLMAAIAYWLLQRAILARQGRESLLAVAVGKDLKGKVSPALYVAAILLAFVSPWIAGAIYVGVALLWLVPDRRIEKVLQTSICLVALIGSTIGCGRPPQLVNGPIDISERPATVRFVQPMPASGRTWELCFEFDPPGGSHHASAIHATLVSATGSRTPFLTQTLDRRGESTVCQIGEAVTPQAGATGVVYEAVEFSSEVPVRVRGIRGGSRT